VHGPCRVCTAHLMMAKYSKFRTVKKLCKAWMNGLTDDAVNGTCVFSSAEIHISSRRLVPLCCKSRNTPGWHLCDNSVEEHTAQINDVEVALRIALQTSRTHETHKHHGARSLLKF
jgi:hypothetical protein